jgi:endoglucanase
MRVILPLLVLFNHFFLSPNFKKTDDSEKKPILNLSATPEIFSFQIGGDTTSITITSNTCWEISSNSLWCKPSVTSGKGDAVVNLYVANNHFNARNCTIKITTKGVKDVNIPVSQQAFNYYRMPDSTGMRTELSAIDFSKLLGLGWNVGNSLESISYSNGVFSGDERSWGNPLISQILIDSVKHAGFNSVRIPVSWSHMIADETTYEISEQWKQRVAEVVNYVLKNEMYAIINIHWDGGWMNNPTISGKDKINKKLDAIWKQLAIYFRDYSNHLIFAGTNEVHVDNYWGNPTDTNLTIQKSFNQTFVNAVRATGGKNTYRYLIVQAYNTNIDLAYNKMNMPTDSTSDRLLAEVHFYDPYEFCLKTDVPYIAKWCDATWGKEDRVNTAFGYMKTKFVDKGIPVILGEYGVVRRSSLTGQTLTDHLASRNYYLEYVTKTAVQNGIVPFYWDNGYSENNGLALFSRSNGAILDNEALKAIIKGGNMKK